MNIPNTAGERFRSVMQMQPVLMKLILANVLVWFLIQLLQLTGLLVNPPASRGDLVWFGMLLPWIGVPAYLPHLAVKPWTIITYMFVHQEFWHLFINMIWLFWFGKIFTGFRAGSRIVSVYFLGGIAGALAYILAYNVFPVFGDSLINSTTIGASASVLAITVATAVLVPDYTVNLIFVGPVKIKYIAVFTIILDILSIRSGNAGGHFAHLGGAVAGAAYVLSIRYSFAERLGFAGSGIFTGSFFRKKPLKKVHRAERPLTDDEYNRQKAEKQKKIDLILDKISRSGYSSLSAEEKEILFHSSRKS
jgi:membrane associated rhomboid family serine protease